MSKTTQNQPAFLKKGDKIAIVSPSGSIDPEIINNAAEVIRSWGLTPIIYKNSKNKYGRFAGTDTERLSDLQEAIDNPEIKAILCSRGGYGAVRIIDKIKFACNKKWLIGFSDITALHAVFAHNNMASIHGIMAKAIANHTKNEQSVSELKSLLFGEKLMYYETETHPYNRKGTCEGMLYGGNLSVLNGLRGTKFDIPTKSILYIEDLSERAYHIDRMMQNLKLSGILSSLSGLIVGQFTDIDKDTSFGNNGVEDIIKKAVEEYDFPVCYNFPVGHVDINMPIKNWTNARLTVSDKKVILEEI